MAVFRASLAITFLLFISLSASASGLMEATNAELLALYLESDDPDQTEQAIKNWIDGYIDGFESAYRLEMAAKKGDIATRKSCVSKHDTDLIYLMLITTGAKENAKELLVVDTMYLMLRFGCQDRADLGELPSWIANGGFDKLGVDIPEVD